MAMNSRRNSRLIKFSVSLAAVFIFIAAIFLVTTGFKVWFAINSLRTVKERRADREVVQSEQVKMRFTGMRASEILHVVHPKVTSQDKRTKATELGSLSLAGVNSLMSADLAPLRMCDLDCVGLGTALSRIKGYSNGLFDIANQPTFDPAFQLAIRLHQAGLGPPGRAVLQTIFEFEKNPYSFNSALSLTKLLWKVEYIGQSIQERGRGPALEADALIALLTAEARSCINESWIRKCDDLDREISAWIDEGALL